MIHVITERDIDQHRPALIAWAEANGLDPDRVDPHGITIEQHGDRHVIAYAEYAVNDHGQKVIDPDRPNQILRVLRSRPLRHALPEGIGRRLCACTLGQLDPDCGDHAGDTRIVLIKPGDVLIIGNIGALPDEAVEQGLGYLDGLKESLGLAGIVLFEGDIDLAAVTPAGVAPSQAAPTSRDGHR